MRGKHYRVRARASRRGLIPAHAGKTFRALPGQLEGRAHPRACGENAPSQKRYPAGAGSSPRMRGKLITLLLPCRRGRLIPAHAGKTSRRSFKHFWMRAHPRACGENMRQWWDAPQEAGSSPRMRGKLVIPDFYAPAVGLIPAHAGKTYSEAFAQGAARAHPRACGENAERSGVLALRSVRSWKTFSFPSSLKVTHCRAFVQLPFSRIRL